MKLKSLSIPIIVIFLFFGLPLISMFLMEFIGYMNWGPIIKNVIDIYLIVLVLFTSYFVSKNLLDARK